MDFASPLRDSITTTVLVSNIHCDSCDEKILEALSSRYDESYLPFKGIDRHQGLVRVIHRPTVEFQEICQVVSDESFDVTGVHTIDPKTRTPRYIPWPPPTLSSDQSSSRLPRIWCVSEESESRKKLHIESCDACQEEQRIRLRNTGHPNAPDDSRIARCDGQESPKRQSIENDSVGDLSDSVVAKSVSPTQPEPTPQAVVEKEKIFKAVLSIGGMTCTSCSNTITDALKRLTFVNEVSINLANNSGAVIFTGKGNIDKIVETVEDVGYDVHTSEVETRGKDQVAPDTTYRTVQYRIDGMYCEHCPPKIESALQAFGSAVSIKTLPTVKDPVITVSYERSPAVNIRSIRDALEIESFKIVVYHPPSLEETAQRRDKQHRNQILLQFSIALVAAIPTFIIGILFMEILSGEHPLRKWAMSPILNGALRGDWATLFPATLVFFTSALPFHQKAIKGVYSLWRKGSKVPILRRFYRFGSMDLLISMGTTIAYLASIAAIALADRQHTVMGSNSYFDAVVLLPTFILIGKWLEAMARTQAGTSVNALAGLKPPKAKLVLFGSPSSAVTLTNGNPYEISSTDASTDAPISRSIDKSPTTTPPEIRDVDSDLVEIGDIVLIPHGSSPPADGILSDPQATFDESALTGESRNVSKTAGDQVFVGTTNTGSPVKIQITSVGGTSMLDAIVDAVREGQFKGAPIARFAEVLTGYFVPVICYLSLLTFLIWLAIGLSGALDRKYVADVPGGWPYYALNFAIAVFVVACPCGIGLASPTALAAGGDIAAKEGIIVRGGGEAFQEASYLDAVVFDKTGTLTEGGELKVSDCEMVEKREHVAKIAWAMICRLEEQSTHPIAVAVLAYAQGRNLGEVHADHVEEVPGLGVRGIFSSTDGDRNFEAAIGSETFMKTLDAEIFSKDSRISAELDRWHRHAKSTAVLATRELDTKELSWVITTIFATTDPVRPSSISTIKTLQSQGIGVYMLSGDNIATAKAVGAALGIPAQNVFGGVLPTQKAERIEWLKNHAPRRGHDPEDTKQKKFIRLRSYDSERAQKDPRNQAKIAFVGDGINDAPALTAAHVSISLSSGTAVAQTSSSFILTSNTLETIPVLLYLSRKVFNRIKLNFAWALVYNVVLVPIAAGVAFKAKSDGFRLGPIYGSMAMALSSVSVVLSSLALKAEWSTMKWWNARKA